MIANVRRFEISWVKFMVMSKDTQAETIAHDFPRDRSIGLRMKTRIFLTVNVLLALSMPGCVDHAPAYRETLITSASDILGDWIIEAKPEQSDATPSVILVNVTPRVVPITNGRLGEYNKPEGTKRSSQGYTFVITLPPEEEHATSKTRAYDAVILSISGREFIAYQLSKDETPVKDYFGDVLPVHKILMLVRSADSLEIRSMKNPLVWIPSIKLPSPPALTPPLPTEQGEWFIHDPDQLEDLITQAAARPELWSDPVIVRRKR
jgi:hypothetical protein